MKTGALRSAILALLIAGGGLPGMRGQSGGVVRMPPFFVNGSRVSPAWRYAAAPGFEVLSSCSDAISESFVYGLWLQLNAFRKVVPPELQFRSSAPTELILLDADDSAMLSQEMLSTMRGSAASGGAASRNWVIPPQLRLGDNDSFAMFVVVPNGLAARRFARGRVAGGAGSMVVGIDPGLANYLLIRRAPPLPAWYIAGVSALYQYAEFRADRVIFHAADWVSREATAGLRGNGRNPRSLLPLADLFRSRTPRSLDPAATARYFALWQAQAQLFVRWALADRGRTDGLRRLLNSPEASAPSDDLLEDCFGLDSVDLEDALSDFLPRFVHDSIVIVPDPPQRFTISFADATPDQHARVWGDWERKECLWAQRSEADQAHYYTSQADRTLLGAYRRGDREPDFLALLGLYESDRGNRVFARSALEQALRAGSERPNAYAELARLRCLDDLDHPEGPKGRLNSEQSAEIWSLLRQANALQPPQLETYLVAAGAAMKGPGAPTPEQRALLNEGRSLFPSSRMLAAGLAAMGRGAD